MYIKNQWTYTNVIMNYRINLKCKICQAKWGLAKKESLSTSCDNDEDTVCFDKGNFYLHLLIMMKMQQPTTYYDIAHQGK